MLRDSWNPSISLQYILSKPYLNTPHKWSKGKKNMTTVVFFYMSTFYNGFLNTHQLLLRLVHNMCSYRSCFKLDVTQTAEENYIHPLLWCSTTTVQHCWPLHSVVFKAKFKPWVPAHKGQYGPGSLYLQGNGETMWESKLSVLLLVWLSTRAPALPLQWRVEGPTKMDMYRSLYKLKHNHANATVWGFSNEFRHQPLLSLWTTHIILYVVLYRNCRWSQSTKNKWHKWRQGFYTTNELSQTKVEGWAGI